VTVTVSCKKSFKRRIDQNLRGFGEMRGRILRTEHA
jgi:hypothetical protein